MSRYPASGARPLFWILILGISTAGLSGLLVWGFIKGRDGAAAEAQREQPVKAAVQVSRANTGLPTITLDPNLQKQADLQVKRPNTAPYQQQVQAYGSVLDLQTFTDLGNTIANAKSQLAIAEAKLAASQAAFQRTQVLHKNQNVSTAQFQAAEATYRSDEASVKAAEVQTQNATASAYQAWGQVLGRSLADGTPLARGLIQREEVLIQITLPVGVSLGRAPQTASIETTTGQRVRIEFVSPATRTDPKIQGISFFYTADAASGALPGMNVTAQLPVGQSTSGIAIPASAVVWLQGRAWVYLQVATNTFIRREIPTTEPQPGGGYVVPALANPQRSELPTSDVDGAEPPLPKNESLVVSGAQVLLSQEFSSQIQGGGD
ncbi:hypothetical protein HYPDE_40393 [Hyphomicrobium denitrificans 1NES1]|uniref:RND family efflux transporter MFP subunit n=1 Tax=Hyphomicrobium denitrificans 1NES1 TaxID=670307 RepID=N0BBV1_9HYPH|nr:multidrug transporter [Hyphomicrobium denitrificans]AGK59747.1 hypothetical protein HYPDE_40393 [Hyphomicrobium denitrificans 1NES1]